MKIVLTGGGTGGHFYPLIAVAEDINELSKNRKLVTPRLFYLSDAPYDPRTLFENFITFGAVPAGKWRRYFSGLNFWDIPKTVLGAVIALVKLFFIYPDVVFGKGGYASFPVLLAARLLRLPVFIHESDAHPGRVNLWAARFAKRVALSFAEAAPHFPKEKIAVIGNPIRHNLLHPLKLGAYEFLKLKPEVPVIYVTGGSQGAMTLNDAVLDILPRLVENYQVIHQVGQNNLAAVKQRADLLLAESLFKERYKIFAFLNESALRMVAGIASLAISRAGAGTIFELAAWGLPAIIVPLPEAVSHDQKENALAYSRSGAALIIEQANLTPSILLSEISRLLNDQKLLGEMRLAALKFAKPDAARLIAEEIINLALAHGG